MSPWTRLLEALEEGPPPIPKSAAAKGFSGYLPGVHDPKDNPRRQQQQPQQQKEGPMPTMPSMGSTSMPTPTTGEEEQDEARGNWAKLDRQRNMARWGTERASRADRAGRTDSDSLERSMRAMRAGSAEPRAEMPPRMVPRPGGLSDIPAGRDVVPQPNPLMRPSAGGGQQAPRRGSSWDILAGVGDDDET